MSTVTVDFSIQDLKSHAMKAAMAIAVFAGMVGVAHCGSGCHPMPSAAAVEAAYTAELLHCSSTAKTLLEAKTCRHGVNTKYGLCDQATWPNVTPCDE